jgi:hypothetical protein
MMAGTDCEAARRNARARYEIELSWGSGVIDLRRLMAILTDPEEHRHEEAGQAEPEGDHVLSGR